MEGRRRATRDGLAFRSLGSSVRDAMLELARGGEGNGVEKFSGDDDERSMLILCGAG